MSINQVMGGFIIDEFGRYEEAPVYCPCGCGEAWPDPCSSACLCGCGARDAEPCKLQPTAKAAA